MRASIRDTELFFDVDGMGLAPEGDDLVERPVLFLLHGGPGGNHTGFKSTLARLRDVAQMVYVDHRGSGRSPAADPATYTLDNNVADVEALREHLHLPRIAVLGMSYGGMVAQGYAINHPDRISGLILIATAPSYRFLEDARSIVESRGTEEQKRVCRRLWDGDFQSMQQAREYFRAMGPMYSRTFDPEKFEKEWPRAQPNLEQLNRGFSGFLRQFDFVDELHRITCPTLVLGGAHDWICPPSHSAVIAEKIPRAQLKIFDNSAHNIIRDETEACLDAITTFLADLPA